MKKAIILGILLLTAFAANAQLRWDVRVGANVSQFSEGGAGLKLGVQAGVTAEYGFSKLFALRPGVRFSMKGSSDSWAFAAGFPKAFNLSYLEVPVLASFRFPITQGFALALNAGPSFNFRVNKAPALLPGVRSFDLGAEAGLDFVFRHLVFGPSAQYGLTNIASVNGEKYHNICYSFTIGYKF